MKLDIVFFIVYRLYCKFNNYITGFRNQQFKKSIVKIICGVDIIHNFKKIKNFTTHASQHKA